MESLHGRCRCLTASYSLDAQGESSVDIGHSLLVEYQVIARNVMRHSAYLQSGFCPRNFQDAVLRVGWDQDSPYVVSKHNKELQYFRRGSS